MEYIWDTGLIVLGLVLLAILLFLAFKPSRKQGKLDAALVDTLRHQKTERIVGKHPAFAAPYNPPTRAITFTPRQLERVNIQRRLRGAAPLNRAGFENAASHAWDQPRRQPDTSSEWLNYFIFYQIFLADHTTPRTAVDHHFTVDPDKPYNGHEGETPDAGAAGHWSGRKAYENGVNAGAGPLPAGDASERVPDPIATGDLPSGAAMGAFLKDTQPTPSYVPDTSDRPSSVPDTYTPPASDPSPSPSYSSSDSSSSYSSSSSDSGSSGGGGGGD